MHTRLSCGQNPRGVPDETEDVGWGFDGERFHVPSPSAAGGHRMCLSGVYVVLITESPLGLRVRSATWGTGSDPKFREEISDEGAPNETLDRERRMAPWLRGGPAQR